MNSFPFSLPASLRSHLELYDKDPEKAIERLTTHLKRRGNDAVGYFLLGWFHHKKGDQQLALSYAGKAKAFAPGSPFFTYLPYFFRHPSGFDAWLPEKQPVSQGTLPQVRIRNDIFVDIDHLITRLSENGTKRIRLEKVGDDDITPPPLKGGEGIATATLAKIHEEQNNFQQAIDIYEQLCNRQPARKEDWKKEIDRLRELMEKQLLQKQSKVKGRKKKSRQEQGRN